jgi:chemotaxis protein histidine kinase CheA
VVSWVAPDGSVPDTNSGKAISVTLTNPAIRSGAKVYSIIGNQSRLLGTATADGSVTTLITEDPVLMVINPAVVAAPSFVSAPAAVDNSAALAAAKELADKKAAEEAAIKSAAEAKAAEEAAALKAAQEKMAADAKALAEAKAAADAAAIKAAQDAADASAKVAAALQAAKDAELAALDAAKTIKPAVTLYTLSSSLKLNAYDSAYLTKYVKSLKNGASVTCIGYIYSKNTTAKKATALAKSQAAAVCAQMKKINKSLKTSIVIYPATKAPKAAVGAKWVGVSYRIDGFKK